MSTNKLPHGLQQAVNQLGNDCMDSSAAIEAIHAAHAGHVAALARIAELEIERNDLCARLAEIEAQEPVATVETSGSQGAGIGWTGSAQPVCSKLYARPVPAQAVPDGCGACGDGCARRGSCRLADESPEAVDGLVSVLCYDEVLTFTFCDEAAADNFAGRFDPSVDSAAAPEHKA